jgi:polysaccharide export outer membrane protein
MKRSLITTVLLVGAALCVAVSVSAQSKSQRPALISSKPPATPPPAPVPNYIIGADDVLTVSVFHEKDFSGDIIVRPDGKITPPGVGNDIVAAGLTVDELKAKIIEELKTKYFDSPDVSVAVKTINSRWVYITGAVAKPGRYPLTGTMTVLQLITNAGGLQEFADKKNVMLLSATLKNKDGSPLSYKINYADLAKGKNPAKNNIELRPGDQVIVP